VNHLYNHGYVARMDSFRKELIQSAQKRELSALEGAPPDERDAWNRVLSARLQEAHEGCHITEGAVRALLEIPAGEPLPWDRAGT